MYGFSFPPCRYMILKCHHFCKFALKYNSDFINTATNNTYRPYQATVKRFTSKMGPKKRKDTKQKDSANEAATNDEPAEKVPKLKKKQSSRAAIPDVSALDFKSEAKTSDGKLWNKKFASWNINGIRAWLEKNGHSYITHEKPDILCVQETKCEKEKIPKELNIEGYHTYWLSGDKEGYSGVGMYSKEKPIDVTYGIGQKKHDGEGRVITAEFEKYYFVTAYIPNSGRGLPRLPYRTKEWDPAFRKYLKSLDEKKPVILCGDLNVAHLDIDLKNPKSNKKTAGFTEQEREQFGLLLEEGFIDSFRHLYPDKEEIYSYWTYMMNARGKNVGWRLDYFVLSERLKDNLCDSLMRSDVMGSDHCPIVCLMHFE